MLQNLANLLMLQDILLGLGCIIILAIYCDTLKVSVSCIGIMIFCYFIIVIICLYITAVKKSFAILGWTYILLGILATDQTQAPG